MVPQIMSILRIGDWIVIGAISLTTLTLAIPGDGSAVGTAAFIRSSSGSDGPYVLTGSQTIEYHGPLGATVVEIEVSKARIVSSPCRHQLCVNTGWIRTAGQVAVCLPNRVFVHLAGAAGTRSDLDAVTQ